MKYHNWMTSYRRNTMGHPLNLLDPSNNQTTHTIARSPNNPHEMAHLLHILTADKWKNYHNIAINKNYPTLSATFLENPTLCGTEVGQNGTLAVLVYVDCRQWESPPPGWIVLSLIQLPLVNIKRWISPTRRNSFNIHSTLSWNYQTGDQTP